MTSGKSIVASRIAWAISTILIVTSSGCARLHSHVNNHVKCVHDQPDRVEPVPTVDVGGQVHAPQRIQIGDGGLTLRRALMLAGGARELVVSEARATPQSDVVTELEELKAISRDFGMYVFYTEVHDRLLANIATDITGLTRDQVDQARNGSDSKSIAIVDRLSGTFGQQFLNELKGYSGDVGTLQEKLRLYEKLQAHQFFEENTDELKEQLESALEAETGVINQLAGSTGAVALLSHRAEFLVALERNDSQPPLTYYFPYALVIAGQAGEIELRSDDAVHVVDLRDTTLDPLAPAAVSVNQNLLIQGFATAPSMRVPLPTIGDVHANSDRTINDPRGVWMLVRRSADGEGTSVFVLPDNFVTSDGPATKSATYDGDVYAYTILPRVPIVFESLVTRSLTTGTLQATRQRLLANHGAIRRHHGAHEHHILENVCNRGPASGIPRPDHHGVLPR